MSLYVNRSHEENLSESESQFYNDYKWSLNLYPTVSEVKIHLINEINKLETIQCQWQEEEVRANIFLLSCSLSDVADDFLMGKRFDFSNLKRKLAPLSPLINLIQVILNLYQRRSEKCLIPFRKWRCDWDNALNSLLCSYSTREHVDENVYLLASNSLTELLDSPGPKDFEMKCIKNPRAFRTQDFTFGDIIILSEKFCHELTETHIPYLLLGLRTAGSYFAPVLRSVLLNKNYSDVGLLTIRPKEGVNDHDAKIIKDYALRGGKVVIIDEPVYQGETFAICMKILHDLGFSADYIVAMFPVHIAALDWEQKVAGVALHGCKVITLNPEESEKFAQLGFKEVEKTIRPNFQQMGWDSVKVINDENARHYNAYLKSMSDDEMHTRLKRVHAVKLKKENGEQKTCYIIGKSIGWGWLGYQTWFAAQELNQFVPRLISLKNGIMYSEWLEYGSPDSNGEDRAHLIDVMSDYIALRVRKLAFREELSSSLFKSGAQFGMDILLKILLSAYQRSDMQKIMHNEIKSNLLKLPQPFSCLLDGKMRPIEWVSDGKSLRKTDYEQHGMGRMELGIIDPAYDLANAILTMSMSNSEESEFINRYIKQTCDHEIRHRLPLYSILSGEWEMGYALSILNNRKHSQRQVEASDAYIRAWTFSMVQMAKFLGRLIPNVAKTNPDIPMVFLDVDGVIDQYVFKFPTSTLSGVRAISLLRTQGFQIYLNSARSSYDVKEYCTAYGFRGGIAEAGSYIWDAVTGQEKVMVEADSLKALERVREMLQSLPGVFLNKYYKYSIKAFTYQDNSGTVPLPSVLVNRVLEEVNAITSLKVHQTERDTIITCQNVDKGTALVALLKLIYRENARTIAVGDTKLDLDMFRVVDYCYAPGNTRVNDLATLLKCKVMSRNYQKGFLDIAKDIVRKHGTVQQCDDLIFEGTPHEQILIDLLGDIEASWKRKLFKALFDFKTLPDLLK